MVSSLIFLIGTEEWVGAQCESRAMVMPEFAEYVLAESVDFPLERLGRNARGLSVRETVNVVTVPRGRVVLLLTEAGPAVQIFDPVSQRNVWTRRENLGQRVTGRVAEQGKGPEFEAFTVVSRRPVVFTLRTERAGAGGSITLPAGLELRVVDESGEFVRVSARGHSGWVLRSSLESSTEEPLAVLASLPQNAAGELARGDSVGEVGKDLVLFQTSNAHAYRELLPMELTARVLDKLKYPVPGQRAGKWARKACKYDVGLVWGPFMDEDIVAMRLGDHQVQERCPFVFKPFRGMFWAVFLLAVDDPEVERKLDAVRKGDRIRLIGSLIDLHGPKGRATPVPSSITGAFHFTMLVREVEM